jgi:alpha-L-fucosidase
MKSIIIVSLVATGVLAGRITAAVPPPAPYGAVPDAKQLEWHELEVYGLVCFNMATFKNVEWDDGATPVSKFNPTDFSAEQIAKACSDGGLKGLIFVAKHHDGFCLWPSTTTEYSIRNTPWKNGKGDLLKEFVDATRAEGMKVGMYLSPWDRNHAEYGRPAYLAAYRQQMREILSNYGPVFEMWFDGANGGTGYYGGANQRRSIDNRTYYDWPNTWQTVRELQPEACIFSDAGPEVRWNGNEHGGTGGTCWATIDNSEHLPGHADTKLLNTGTRGGTSWIPAESDFPLRLHPKGWYHHPGHKSATPAELVSIYFRTVGMNTSMNIGIAPDLRGRLCDDDVAALKDFGGRIEAIFKTNLAQSATLTASNVRGNDPAYAAQNVILGKSKFRHYWATDDAVLTPELLMDFGTPTTFSVISLREAIQLGHRVDDWALDAWQDGAWREFAASTGIGARRLWRGQPVTSDKVRLRITKAAACPAISEFGVYLEPEASRMEAGRSITPHLEKGLSKNNWIIVSATSEGAPAANTIDNDSATLWHTHTTAGRQPPPQEIVVDMGRELELTGFLYLPRQDGNAIGNVDRYAFHVSADGKTWGEAVATGEFPNIVNSPDQQRVIFGKPVNGRFFKFVALHAAVGDCVCAAEIGVLGSGPKSGAATNPGALAPANDGNTLICPATTPPPNQAVVDIPSLTHRPASL